MSEEGEYVKAYLFSITTKDPEIETSDKAKEEALNRMLNTRRENRSKLVHTLVEQ